LIAWGWGGFVLFLVWRWKFVGVFSGKGVVRTIKGAIRPGKGEDLDPSAGPSASEFVFSRFFPTQ